MSLKIIYGNLNITNFALQNCVLNNILTIPEENRLELFGKQLFREDREVKITYNGKFIPEGKIDISGLELGPREEKLTVLFGVSGFYKDVTSLVLSTCCHNGILYIATNDEYRSALFGDPIFGVLKHIKVLYKNQWRLYSDAEIVLLDVTGCVAIPVIVEEAPCVKLAKIHSQLKFVHGHLYDEYPEQLMIVTHLREDRKVLEVGSNIGRATSVIASLLTNQKNLVTLECDLTSFRKLLDNRQHNNFKYHAENAALSYKPLLLKSQDCVSFTINSEVGIPGYDKVRSITFEELEAKYSITFDTLVVDCEGALYYILMDNPGILDNISLIIMENDYRDITHKNSVDRTLLRKGLTRVYFEAGGWNPCYNNFYEVWKRLE